MDTVWIVRASTGENDDYRQYNICAYRDKMLADHHARLANAKAKAFPEHWRKNRKQDQWNWDECYREFVGDLDPNGQFDGDVEYEVQELRIYPGVPLHARLEEGS